MRPKLRLATIRDIESIQTLNAKIFVNNPKYDNDLIIDFMFSERGYQYLKDAIEAKDGCFYLLEENGRLIGYANGIALEIPYRHSKYFEIQNLGIIPQKKSKGFGKMLLNKVTQWAKDNGFEKLYLNCYASNEEALRFYRKNGFVDIDVCLEKKIN